MLILPVPPGPLCPLKVDPDMSTLAPAAASSPRNFLRSKDRIVDSPVRALRNVLQCCLSENNRTREKQKQQANCRGSMTAHDVAISKSWAVIDRPYNIFLAEKCALLYLAVR